MTSPASPVQAAQQLPEKWITRLDAQVSVADAAQHVLDRRIGSTASILKAMAKTGADGDEHVHQLRVATRRAQSALLSFKPWLRRERRRAVNKSLRQIRTAAGLVRMCDVHRGMLTPLIVDSVGEVRMALEAALMMLQHDRRQAMRSLHRLAKRDSIRRCLGERGSRWFRRADDPAPAMTAPVNGRPSPAASMEVAGEDALRSLAGKVRDAALGELSTREQLHNLRLCFKRLRYAIEIFGAASTQAPTLVGLSATLVDLQERLGAVNDAHEVAERLARYAAAFDEVLGDAAASGDVVHSALAPAIERFADRFESHCAQLVAAFHDWWRGEQSQQFRDGLALIAAEPAPSIEPAPVEVVVLASSNGLAATESVDDPTLGGEG